MSRSEFFFKIREKKETERKERVLLVDDWEAGF